MKTINKPLLIELIKNRFNNIDINIKEYAGGQTQITLSNSGEIVNIYNTGKITFQGTVNDKFESIIEDFVKIIERQE